VTKGQIDTDDWSSASEGLFRGARTGHDPTALDRARVRRALAQRLAAGAVVTLTAEGSAQAATSPSAQGVLLSKVLKISMSVAVVAAGSVAMFQNFASPSARPQAPEVRVQTQAPTPDAGARPFPSATKSDEPTALDLALRGPLAKQLASQNDRPLRATARTRSPHKQAVRAKRTTLERPVVQSSVTPPSAATASTTAAKVSSSVTTVGSEHQSASAPVEAASPRAAVITQAQAKPEQHAAREPEAVDARAELVFVERMQAALRNTNPSLALALCAEHERRWPHGTFSEEREGVRAIASCNMHSKQAASRARVFLANHPHAPLALRVTAACATQLPASEPR
jgi:hypothetical protein